MPRGIGYGNRRNTGRNVRRAQNRVGRPTRAQGTMRARANLTGNMQSTRMARGRAANSFVSRPNTNSISRMGRGSARNIGQSAAMRAAKIPANYVPMRMVRTDAAAKGKPAHRVVYCPPNQTHYTNACVEAPAGASTSYVAQTSGVRKMTGRR